MLAYLREKRRNHNLIQTRQGNVNGGESTVKRYEFIIDLWMIREFKDLKAEEEDEEEEEEEEPGRRTRMRMRMRARMDQG